MKRKGILFVIVPLAVIVLGMIGYCGYLGYSAYEGLLTSLKMLKVEFGGITNNFFVETARCLGIIFYFSLLYAILYALNNAIKLFLNVRHTDSIAVHGDSSMAQFCAKSIHGGKHCVQSDSKESFRAPKQIIWFSDDVKSMNFYENNKSFLAKDDVYIALSSIPLDGKSEENVHFFNINENIAVKYWAQHFITSSKKVVIIGSGALAEVILEQALLMNVYSKTGSIKYHVIGDFSVYRAMHPALQDAVNLTHDELVFANNAWHLQMDEIKTADRVILVGKSEDNTAIARLLNNYGIKAEIHLMAESDETKLLFQEEKVEVFGTLKELLGKDGDAIFQDEIHKAGKLLDATYGVMSEIIDNEKGVIKSENEETLDKLYSKSKKEWLEGNRSWNGLSSFLKRSNYSAAQHSVVKEWILKKALTDNNSVISFEDYVGSGVKGALEFWSDLNNKTIIEELEEIEHLRWWRLYLLNNFTYNENVESTDKWRLRQNRNMKDYALLDETTKRYDGMHYWLLAFKDTNANNETTV